uniref:Ribosomal protein L5 n=1 Tax=Ophirina amphinema TaxID=2108040 RepID=A0A348AYR5_9EUKA|nr:ribosomal protein L5 [Ophirina amphinema]
MRFSDWHYYSIVRPDLIASGSYHNCMSLPRLTALSIVSSGSAIIREGKLLPVYMCLLELITGRRPAIIRARRSVSSFKLRQGMLIGCGVRVCSHPMLYELLQRGALSVAYRRWMRSSSHGFYQSISSQGNLSFGFSDGFFFPQLDTEFDKFPSGMGGNVNVTSSSSSVEEASLLFSLIGLPLK